MEKDLNTENTRDLPALFKKLYDIIVLLREPSGCPWDKKQTARSIRGNLIEEAYECVSAVDESDDENLKEELGDLLLVISMIIRIKEQEHAFTYSEVLKEICAKLIRRHPHVFGNETLKTAEEVVITWEKIKTDVEGKKTEHSILENIPGALPPLEKALSIQKKVSKVGFDWKKLEPVWEKLDEEIQEFKAAVQNNMSEQSEEELGDILFTIVNIGRLLKINSALALHRTNDKFMKRFIELEKRTREKGIKLEDAGLEILDRMWDEIKNEEIKA
ncbi:MAG: nucleoside triphosphate pyrophosphohydrolase [Spirochaetales bacterium]|nr:nucleoside triphosphate pyrophosphohydrolase [Spirochaetales bacterium]